MRWKMIFTSTTTLVYKVPKNDRNGGDLRLFDPSEESQFQIIVPEIIIQRFYV